MLKNGRSHRGCEGHVARYHLSNGVSKLIAAIPSARAEPAMDGEAIEEPAGSVAPAQHGVVSDQLRPAHEELTSSGRSLRRLSGWAASPTTRSLFSAIFAVGAIGLVARLALAGKEILIANFFGSSVALDAFLLALAIPTFIQITTLSALPPAFVPAIVDAATRGGRQEADHLIARCIALTVTCFAGLTLLVAVVGPLYIGISAQEKNASFHDLALSTLYIVSPIILFRSYTAILVAALNARRLFRLGASLALPSSLTIAAILTALGPAPTIGQVAFATLTGFGIEAVLAGIIAARAGIPVLPRWRGKIAGLSRMLGQYAPMIVGTALLSATLLVDQSMAAGLGDGSLSALNYAMLLVGFPAILAASAIGTAVLPHASALASSGQGRGLRTLFLSYAGIALMIGVVVTAVYCLFPTRLVSLVFERGSFTREDTAVVSFILPILALQAPAFIAGNIAAQILASLRRTDVLMWGAALSLSLKLVLNHIFIDDLELAGIALSTSIMYWCSMIFSSAFCLFLIRRTGHV